MSYLLDTNVVSELRKRRPDQAVAAWFQSVPATGLHLSCLTVGEIRIGVERLRRRDEARAAATEHWLNGLRILFGDRIAPVDIAVTEAWARINVPEQLPVVDGLLAATALSRGWTMVTRNTADFARSGVPLLDPWTPPAR